MPIRGGRSQWLSGVSHALIALGLLAACTSTTSGHAQDSVYDFEIFLCPPPPASRQCPHETTQEQLSAIRSALSADPDVADVRYLSQHDTYLVGRQVLGAKAGRVLEPGFLPAVFWVDATDGRQDAASARYVGLAGVSTVRPCGGTADGCSADVLRTVGLIH